MKKKKVDMRAPSRTQQRILKAIKSAIAAEGMSEADVAALLGADPTLIGFYLDGQAPIPPASLATLAAEFELDGLELVHLALQDAVATHLEAYAVIVTRDLVGSRH